jgi:hypothetical protein
MRVCALRTADSATLVAALKLKASGVVSGADSVAM